MKDWKGKGKAKAKERVRSRPPPLERKPRALPEKSRFTSNLERLKQARRGAALLSDESDRGDESSDTSTSGSASSLDDFIEEDDTDRTQVLAEVSATISH